MGSNKNVVLIGMPGVGKSTVGVLLAKRQSLYSRFADLTVFTDGLTPDQIVEEIIEIIAISK